MKNPYTWNHISLLAKLCESVDDNYSITASWINIVETHHSTTFPFTLWPLTYRTSDVNTSPSICSPIFLQFPGTVCDIAVKVYVCNEVIIVCIQNDDIFDEEGSNCVEPCGVGGSVSVTTSGHKQRHCDDENTRLLPCNVSTIYPRIKEEVLPHIYTSHMESRGSIDCVIFVGHGFSASIASCLASDIGRTFESQREHLGLDKKLVGVDFVGFSSTPLASNAYWESVGTSIDNYISVDLARGRVPRQVLISNPMCSYLLIGEKNKHKGSGSVMKIRSKFGGGKNSDSRTTSIREILSQLSKKITPVVYNTHTK